MGQKEPNTVTISRDLLEAYRAAVDELADQFYSQIDYDLNDRTRRLIQRVDALQDQWQAFGARGDSAVDSDASTPH